MGFVLKLCMIGMTIYGSVKTADVAWALGDMGVGLMAWLNIIAILLMHNMAFKCLRDYEAQKAQGKDPEFNPVALGIKNADYWEKRAAGRKQEAVAEVR
jgi:AGCS family alanine or glycine:cation symporter